MAQPRNEREVRKVSSCATVAACRYVNECTVWNRRVLSSRAADRMRWKLEFVDVLRHAPKLRMHEI